jgi:hypothetical protein
MSVPRITIGLVPYLGKKLPFDRLTKVGDKFFVPKERRNPMNVKESVRQRNKKDRGKFSYDETFDGVLVTKEPDESIT